MGILPTGAAATRSKSAMVQMGWSSLLIRAYKTGGDGKVGAAAFAVPATCATGEKACANTTTASCSQILPEKCSYYRRLENDQSPSTDCVICMTSIDVTPQSNDYMVTPCDHFFHSGCLQRWMDIKMECPTCRRPLPPA